ncbi:MAG: DUF2282 domain-containing protein [Alphaproteobacteria bacterium]|nr:DUF2282 domain-containing protein [Alphaproteobacteria bacterium]
MHKNLLGLGLAGVIAAGVAFAAQADEMAAPKEKCYGIAKAGKNDCKSAAGSHSCAGQATKDGDPADWKFVKAGECSTMGGSLEYKKM